ncbi:hypothetical protein ACYX34_01795 [Nitrospira sp. CMX1]|nr:hypothetical protein [Nitrospira sp.]
MMSAHWTCWLGTVVGAGCLGWGIKGLVLGPVIDDKRLEVERLTSKVAMLTKLTNQPPEVRTVEKRVEVPVERVVVKRVEVPVEKIIEKVVEVPIEKAVDRPIDNPEHLARIKALEGEVGMIAGLLTQIAQLQTTASQTGGRGIEGRVLVPVDNQEQLDRIKALEGEVAVIDDLRVQIAELQAASVQAGNKVVEKRVESPSEQSEKVLIDNPEHLARIQTLEAEVAEIDVLRVQIAELRALSVRAGGKGVEARIEAAVEKDVRVPVDNSEYLARIKELEGEVAGIAELRAKIAELWKSSVQTSEKGVETQGEPSIEESRELPVIQVDEHKEGLDHAGAVAQSEGGSADTESPDDLKHIRGVGQALERFLHKRGVFWFKQVATWSETDIDKFEFLLPNFSGRIQRENWVRSAQVEHYKKYQQWLGEGEPPNESPDLPAQISQLQATPSQAGEKGVEKRIETLTGKDSDVRVVQVSECRRGLDHAGAVESEEGSADTESPDDLKQIRGVGQALERFLHKRGVFWFKQVATWSEADIDKFEFLLPNFSGRIQRENWVRSAQVEHYKKYQQWLGNGEPPRASLEFPVKSDALQATSLQPEEQVVEGRVETSAVSNEEVRIERTNGLLEEEQASNESPDDLKHIRGVGPALERFLHKRGVFWFSQVATWNQADIDKFEFLLPNFGGRIQRENWVRSAQVEYYKKYQQWLGEGEPPRESLDLSMQIAESETASSQAKEQVAEECIETPAETQRETSINRVSEPTVDLNRAGAVKQLDQ